MSKYNLLRITTVVLIFIAWYFHSYFAIGILLIIYFSLLGLGAYFIRWNFYFKATNHLPNADGLLLTFDDGPHPQYTPQILDVLKAHQAKAVFFVIGKNLAGNESIVKRMVDEGHTIGTHSWSHAFWFDMYGAAKMKAEIQKTQDYIKQITGKVPLLFRPPYGVTNPNLATAMLQTNIHSMGWNIRSFDTQSTDADKIFSKIQSRLQPNNILLLHDSLPHGAELLQKVLLFCKKEKVSLVDYSEYAECYE